MNWLLDPNHWISFLTLAVLEVVLGVDNLIFISILSGKLPPHQQSRARKTGLVLAVITRVMLLLSLSWVMSLDRPFWRGEIAGLVLTPSGKDVVLILGGLFLVAKSTREIHEKLEARRPADVQSKSSASFVGVVIQILMLDIVFSLDSVITAVGMTNQIGIMVAAVLVAMVVMVTSADWVSRLVERHPTLKMLALAFLILIGTMLLAQGCHQPIPKGYLYFAMAFAAVVEALNIRLRHSTAVSNPETRAQNPPPPR